MSREIRVLMAEDVEDDAQLILRRLRKSGFNPGYIRVQTREEYREALLNQYWDLVLCDYKMPRFSAPEALKILQETGLDLPFIVVSGTVGEDVAVECLRSGAVDFVSKENLTRLSTAIARELSDAATRRARRVAEEGLRRSADSARRIVAASRDGMVVVDDDGRVAFANPTAETMLGKSSEELVGHPLGFPVALGHGSEMRLEASSEAPVTVEMDVSSVDWGGSPHFLVALHDVTLRKQVETNLRESFLNLADTLSRAMASRDPYTTGHQQRVAEMVVRVGDRMGLSERDMWELRLAGLLHDVGKIAIPESLLTKPGKLTEEEFALVRTHTQEGYDILKGAGLPDGVALMALRHHENLDGSGYPQKLSADSLGLTDRILNACNVLESLTSFRPYRRALGLKDAFASLVAGSGTRHDPAVLSCLEGMLEKGELVPGGR